MTIQKLNSKHIKTWLPKRNPDSHKGDYGHVLIVAGSKGMSGASILSASGALRGGAGLVSVAVPVSQQPILAKRVRPEGMTLALPETKEGTFSEKAVAPLLEFVRRRKITSIAIGPGISRHPETVLFVRKFLSLLSQLLKDPSPQSSPLRGEGRVREIVLDADGFLALKPKNKKDFFLETLALPMIVTPHPGELANFLGIKTAQVQQNRIQFAKQFAKLYSVICVLKGNQTIVSDGKEVFLNTTGNPGMATGGSGDVLTGLIAALIGQLPASNLVRAACAGVYIHGLAGDLAKKEKTEISMLAGDIAENIPEAFQIALSWLR